MCVPQAPYSVTVRRRAATSARTPTTRALQAHSICPAHCLPVSHMQEAENPGSAMLQQRTPQPRAHRPVPALNMRPSWTSALPSLHTHAERRTALLCPRAPQSVHASTNTHQASCTTRRPTQTPMPTLPRPLTLPPGALTTHPTHTASPQATETQELQTWQLQRRQVHTL